MGISKIDGYSHVSTRYNFAFFFIFLWYSIMKFFNNIWNCNGCIDKDLLDRYKGGVHGV